MANGIYRRTVERLNYDLDETDLGRYGLFFWQQCSISVTN